jgi:hypothetical protein
MSHFFKGPPKKSFLYALSNSLIENTDVEGGLKHISHSVRTASEIGKPANLCNS